MPDSAGQCWDLVCEGLDTLATIWINGIQIGQAANMLIEHRFDVTNVLRPGQINHIAIRLNSAVNYARSLRFDGGVMSWEHREEGLYVRKAPHVWGWDIMPRAVSAGIWRSIYLENHPATAIEQLYYWTADVNSQGATLGVRFQFRMDGPT
jgi:beta-mannosidase